MNPARLIQHPSFRYLFALIWLVNGLWCKVLGMVPRHQEIVAAIISPAVASPLTLAIGFAEMGMAAWIIWGWRYRFCAVLQIAIILLMNVIEFFAVPELLLWGRWNIVFAVLLCVAIYWNAFPPGQNAHA
ncbi:MAG: DoxX-like family protein [Flavobacteriales bacterium]|nr:DoxX-like family protein [Flavobacteriales bacterium]